MGSLVSLDLKALINISSVKEGTDNPQYDAAIEMDKTSPLDTPYQIPM